MHTNLYIYIHIRIYIYIYMHTCRFRKDIRERLENIERGMDSIAGIERRMANVEQQLEQIQELMSQWADW